MGVVDFGLTADAAVGAPRIHHQWLPEVLLVEAGLPDTTRKALERVGHKVVPLNAKASVQAVEVTGRGAARVLTAPPATRARAAYRPATDRNRGLTPISSLLRIPAK